MRFLGTLPRVAHIWLTALMVLIAGSPYISCRCPDGHLKLFCFTSLAPVNGCCCGGAPCCGSPNEKPLCCQGGKDQRASDSRSGIADTGCTKILTSPAVVVVSDDHEIVPSPELSGLLVSTLSPVLVLPTSDVAHSPLAWRDYHSPPPLDPLDALRHLLI